MRFGDENERNEKNKIGEVFFKNNRQNQMLAKSLFCRIGRRVVMQKALVMLYTCNAFMLGKAMVCSRQPP